VLEDLAAPIRAPQARVPGADPGEVRAALAKGPLVMPFGGRAVRVEREGEGVRFAVLDAAFPLSAKVEVSIVDRGAPASARAQELRDALWDQLGLVLRYRAAEVGREASVRDRIAARVREREEEQAELVAAVRAGAEGLVPVTYGERDPAARDPAEGGQRPGSGGPVLILGPR